MLGSDLGDLRLTRRLGVLIERAAANPSGSFPAMARSDSELEATYRFLKNRRVTPEAILEGHYVATRARARGPTLVLHDTTELSFSGDVERDGMGVVGNHAQGFFAHIALAVAEDQARSPLGVIGLRTHARPRRRSADVAQEKESKRWIDLVDDVRARLDPATTIHVMDREADWGKLLTHLHDTESRFVIRLAYDRLIEGDVPHLREAFASVADRDAREVELSRRSNRNRRLTAKHRHPARDARSARLSVSARAVILKNAGHPIALHVVHVVEREPPEGQVPVEWWLLTSEPIDTTADLWRVVDVYRARWLVEELFKALKTGCRVEDRQLESQHGLLNALALLLPVAWQLLALRALSRSDGTRDATTVLTPRQLEVLRHCGRTKLPASPTVTDALLAVAALGGHIKNNGAPGWLVLGRGMDDLLLLELGWVAARRSQEM